MLGRTEKLLYKPSSPHTPLPQTVQVHGRYEQQWRFVWALVFASWKLQLYWLLSLVFGWERNFWHIQIVQDHCYDWDWGILYFCFSSVLAAMLGLVERWDEIWYEKWWGDMSLWMRRVSRKRDVAWWGVSCCVVIAMFQEQRVIVYLASVRSCVELNRKS